MLYVAVRVRRVARACRSSDAFDPVLRMREAFASVVGPRTPTRLVADEVSMLRYLVRPPGGEPGPGATTFSYHRRSGWGALVFALSLVVELSRPVRFDDPFGVDRDVRRLGLVADDPDALLSALAEDARPLRSGGTGP